MTTSTLLTDLLFNSRTEQRPVTVFFRSGSLKGIVSELDTAAVTLRTADHKHCCILLDRIDAVVQEG